MHYEVILAYMLAMFYFFVCDHFCSNTRLLPQAYLKAVIYNYWSQKYTPFYHETKDIFIYKELLHNEFLHYYY